MITNEEILNESDEEDITFEELIKKMKLFWQNEKASIILLEHQTEIIDLINSQLNMYEENTNLNHEELFVQHLRKLQIERIKFIINDYSRTRLMKIEEHCDYYLKQSANNNNLTPAEKESALLYQQSLTGHLMETVISETNPGANINLSQFADAPPPNFDRLMFCFAIESVEINVSANFNANSDMMTFNVNAGDQFVAKFRSVEAHLKAGSVVLI